MKITSEARPESVMRNLDTLLCRTTIIIPSILSALTMFLTNIEDIIPEKYGGLMSMMLTLSTVMSGFLMKHQLKISNRAVLDAQGSHRAQLDSPHNDGFSHTPLPSREIPPVFHGSALPPALQDLDSIVTDVTPIVRNAGSIFTQTRDALGRGEGLTTRRSVNMDRDVLDAIANLEKGK